MKKLNLPMKEIYEMHQNDTSVKELANLYHCSVASVRTHLKSYCEENNLPLRYKRHRKSLPLPIEEIYEMHQAGITVKEMVDSYPCTRVTIYNHLHLYCKKNNLTLVPQSNHQRPKRHLPLEEVYKQYQTGESYDSLGKKFNYPRTIIRKEIIAYCKKNNLPLYKKSSCQNIEMMIHQLYKMYQSGESYNRLGKKFNCSYRTIFRKLHQYSEENNLPLRDPHCKRKCTPSSSNLPESINENNPNIEQFEKRKELLSQLKNLLQKSQELVTNNNETVYEVIKPKEKQLVFQNK